jgi:hypothetical protein
MHLPNSGFCKRFTSLVYKSILGFCQFLFKESLYFSNRLNNRLQVEFDERSCVTHCFSFSPVKQNFPQPQRCIMYFLHLLVVGCAGKFRPGNFTTFVVTIFLIKKLEELLVKSNFRSNLMDSLRSFEKFLERNITLIKSILVFKIVLLISLLEQLDLFGKRI